MDEPVEIAIRGESIDLDQFLKLCGAVSSGGEAKYFIGEGMVFVNTEPESRRRRTLRVGDRVSVEEVGEFIVTSDDGESA